MNVTPEQRKKYKEELDKIDRILLDYEEHHEPYCITNYVSRKGNKKSKVEPITCDRFIKPLLEDKIIIQMSATLSKPEDGDWAYLETNSPFPISIRKWQYLPLGRMSLKHRNQTLPKVAEWMQQLKGKTLVHCVSYQVASDLADLLRMNKVFPLLQTNDDEEVYEDTVMRWDAVRAFKEARDPDKILLSVKLERGVDFPEPEIINNVILCVPFFNPTEPLTKAKNNTIGLSWQDVKISQTIEQSYGRINRNADKTTMTYIVDSNFNNMEMSFWYQRNKNNFHSWFKEAELGYDAGLMKIFEDQNKLKLEVKL